MWDIHQSQCTHSFRNTSRHANNMILIIDVVTCLTSVFFSLKSRNHNFYKVGLWCCYTEKKTLFQIYFQTFSHWHALEWKCSVPWFRIVIISTWTPIVSASHDQFLWALLEVASVTLIYKAWQYKFIFKITIVNNEILWIVSGLSTEFHQKNFTYLVHYFYFQGLKVNNVDFRFLLRIARLRHRDHLS